MQNVSVVELKQLLDCYLIKVVLLYVQLVELCDNLDVVVVFNCLIGNSMLVVFYLDQKDCLCDVVGWIVLGWELGWIVRQVCGKGMQLVYYNYDFELVDFNGRIGLELLFVVVGFELQIELDLVWVVCVGLDLVVMLGKFRGYVFVVYVKDNVFKGQVEDEGGFVVVGQGVLDWNVILLVVVIVGVQWYIVEYDQLCDLVKVIQVGVDYLCGYLIINLFICVYC